MNSIKRKPYIKNIIFAIVSVVLIHITTLCFFVAPPVNAASASAKPGKLNGTTEYRQNGKSIYLRMDNDAYDKLVKAQNKDRKNAIDKAKQNAIATAKAGVNIYNKWQNGEKPDADDWGKMAFEGAKALIGVAIVACGGAAVAGPVVQIIDTFGSLLFEDRTPSEMDELQRNIELQFGEVKQSLGEIKSQINDVSDRIDKAVENMTEATERIVTSTELKTYLTNFLSGRDGNFNFKKFRNYLYASDAQNSAEQYYDRMLETSLDRSAPEASVKRAYDNLYKALTDGDSDIQDFMSYITGGEIYGSIQSYYYDYLLLGGDNDAERSAFEFALDLYDTAMFADYCISACNNYQLISIVESAAESGEILSEHSEYIMNDGTVITYGDVMRSYDDIENREAILRNRFVKDITYIFNIENSYTVNEGGKFDIIANTDPNTFGYLLPGQTVYLNNLTSNITGLFDITQNEISFDYGEILPSGVTFIGDRDNGVFTVADGFNPFTAKLLLNDPLDPEGDGTEIYSIEFKPIDENEFAGGSGGEESPYLIANAKQFLRIAESKESLKKSYKLICDIDFYDKSFTSIGSADMPFTGVLDGNGHTVSGISVNINNAAGLFGAIGDEGRVEGLTLKNAVITGDSYSEIRNTESGYGDDKKIKMYVGGIAGINEGIIENCKVISSTIVAEQENNEKDNAVYTYGGGIAGINYGTIRNCGCEGNTVDIGSAHDYGNASDGRNMHYVYAGGIAGYMLSSTVENCYVDTGASVKGYAESTGKTRDTMHPVVNLRVGGIVGETAAHCKVMNVYANAEITSKIYVKNNKSDILWSGKEDNDKCSEKKGDTIGSSSYATDLVAINRRPDIATVSSVHNATYEIDKTVFKTVYDFCDSVFDPTGLTVKVDGKTVDNDKITFIFSTRKAGSDLSATGLVNTVDDGGDRITASFTIGGFTVNEKKVVGIDTVFDDNAKTVFTTGEPFSYAGVSVVATYNDGSVADVTTDATFECKDFAKIGNYEVVVIYGAVSTAYRIGVTHDHEFGSANTVDPTCVSEGYQYIECTKDGCGLKHVERYIPKIEHTTVVYTKDNIPAGVDGVKPMKAASCGDEGYTGDVYCTSCKSVIEYGKILDVEPHSYKILNDKQHQCDACNLSVSDHNFGVYEYQKEEKTVDQKTGVTSVRIITLHRYTCADCGYYYEADLLGAETVEISVSSVCALPKSEAVVYVELDNNVGVEALDFYITYDRRLKFINYEWASDFIIDKQFSNVNNIIDEAGKSISYNFTVSNIKYKSNAAEDKNGILLKLRFAVPDIKPNENEILYYNVNISGHGNVASRIVNHAPQRVEYVTNDGVVIITDHLPGDVNNDGKVDIVDALYVLRNCNSSTPVDTDYNAEYADVNGDNVVDVLDINAICQYVAGKNVYLLNKQFILHFNDNASDKSFGLHSKIVTAGDKYSGLEDLNREGYDFDGWYTELIGGTRVENGNTITYNLNQKLIGQMLYAHWSRITYAVNFNANASDVTGEMSSVVFDIEEIRQLSTNKYAVTGKAFAGWYADAACTEFVVGDGEKFGPEIYMKAGLTLPADRKITLYAKWIESAYTVVLDSGESDYKGTQKINTTYNATLNSIDVPMRKGYNFLGYYDEQGGNGKMYFDSEGKPKSKWDRSDKDEYTLYAKWAAKQSIITLYLTGNDAMPYSSYTETYGESTSVSAIPEPKREGFVFKGFYDAPNDSGTQYIGAAVGGQLQLPSNKAFGEPTILYGHWEEVIYKVTFHSNNNVNSNTVVRADRRYDTAYSLSTPLVVDSYASAEKSASASSVIKFAPVISYNYNGSGTSVLYETVYYEFLGWATSATGDVVYLRDGKIPANAYGLAKDIDLYAKWQARSTVLTSANTTRGNYIFAGWYSDSSCTVRMGDKNKPFTPDKNATYYARWVSSYGSWSASYGNGRDQRITDGDKYTESIRIAGIDLAALRSIGYTRVRITIAFDAKEIDDGYQDLWVYDRNGNELASRTVEHGSGHKDTSWWRHTVTIECESNRLYDNAHFSMRWGAHGWGGDDWWLGQTTITVVPY